MMALSVLRDLRLIVARGVHVRPSSKECSMTREAAEFSSPTSNSSSSENRKRFRGQCTSVDYLPFEEKKITYFLLDLKLVETGTSVRLPCS